MFLRSGLARTGAATLARRRVPVAPSLCAPARFLSTKRFEKLPLPILNKAADKVFEFVTNYGPTGVVVYFSIYGVSLFGIYELLIHNSYALDGIIERLRHYQHLTRALESRGASWENAGALSIAWVIVKLIEPLRFALTLYIAPKLARSLGLSALSKPVRKSARQRLLNARRHYKTGRRELRNLREKTKKP